MVGVSGVRGIVGESLSPEVVLNFVGAYAAYLKQQTTRPRVLVARDTRPTGQMVHHIVWAP
jgi:phosphomannomutase